MRLLKQQISNLESFNYESGNLPLQPNIFKHISPYNVSVMFQNYNIFKKARG